MSNIIIGHSISEHAAAMQGVQTVCSVELQIYAAVPYRLASFLLLIHSCVE